MLKVSYYKNPFDTFRTHNYLKIFQVAKQFLCITQVRHYQNKLAKVTKYTDQIWRMQQCTWTEVSEQSTASLSGLPLL